MSALPFPEPVVARFRGLLRPEGKCRVWVGPREGFLLNGEMLTPARVAWEMSGRGMRETSVLRRLCDTPECVIHVRPTDIRTTGRIGRSGCLSEDQIHEIHRLYWLDRTTPAQISQGYGISRSMAWHVATGRSYAHVPFEEDVIRAMARRRARKS